MTSKLHYEIAGNGPHVVMLHPVGLDLTFLQPVVEMLRENFTVLCVDQRGHGRSPVVPASSLEDYADDIHALLGELRFAPTAVIGFSFGGMVTQTLALKYPGDVNALVICACPATLSPQGREIARARGDDARRDGMTAVLEATLERWFMPRSRAAGTAEASRIRLLSDDPEGWAQAWYAIAGIDTLPHLGAVRVPTLCVAGEFDNASPPDVVKAIADAIPGARYTVMPGAAHMLFIEQPGEFAALARDFLTETLANASHGRT